MHRFYLLTLHSVIRKALPTSPHYLFEDKKSYKQNKKKIDEVFDAEMDVITASKKLEAAFIPMGMNYHFFNYLAPIYGELCLALKTFEKKLKSAFPELKDYYEPLVLPSSKEIYGEMKKDFDHIVPVMEEALEEAKNRNPSWSKWDALEIHHDVVNELFKKNSTPKEDK